MGLLIANGGVSISGNTYFGGNIICGNMISGNMIVSGRLDRSEYRIEFFVFLFGCITVFCVRDSYSSYRFPIHHIPFF